MNKYDEAMKLLDEKPGNKDGLISLSTIAPEPGADGRSRPAARIVDAYYEDGAIHTVTYAALNKCPKSRKTSMSPYVLSQKALRPTVSVKIWVGCVTKKTRK